jgi:2-dehydro-3-deoxyphosphogluconate aldolase / (4S)-4-hydroxy-2-oxoglutarate aldolase
MSAVLDRLTDAGLIVVARRLEEQYIDGVAASLVDAGAPALELTMDQPDAAKSIAELHRKWAGRLLIGAGTVLNPNDAQAAIAAGADFVVSPIFVPSVQRFCRQKEIPYFPGGATPTDVFRILKSGIRTIKLFPASLLTPAYIKDLVEPFRTYQPILMLTGGLGMETIAPYLVAGVSIVGIGKSILDPNALRAGEYPVIRTRAQQVLQAIRSARS